MVINGDLDKSDIISEVLTVQYVCSYIYLGLPITEDGDYASCLWIHTKEKSKHVLKFNSFINKNTDTPYKIKKHVAEACILSTMLYACETWFCDTVQKIETLYENYKGLIICLSNNV